MLGLQKIVFEFVLDIAGSIWILNKLPKLSLCVKHIIVLHIYIEVASFYCLRVCLHLWSVIYIGLQVFTSRRAHNPNLLWKLRNWRLCLKSLSSFFGDFRYSRILKNLILPMALLEGILVDFRNILDFNIQSRSDKAEWQKQVK